MMRRRPAARSPSPLPWLPWNIRAARSTFWTPRAASTSQVRCWRPSRSLTPPSSSAPPKTASLWGWKKPGATARSATCPALSIFPRQMRKTPTITPPSTPCVSASATRSPPSWSPSGTTTRRSPASSTCSTSAPTRCRTANGWRSSCPRAKRTWSPSSTTL